MTDREIMKRIEKILDKPLFVLRINYKSGLYEKTSEIIGSAALFKALK